MKKVIVNIGRGFVSAGSILGRVFGSIAKIDAIYRAMTPEAKAAMVKTFGDVLTFVATAEAAAASEGTNFALDGAVYAAAKQLYSDAVLDVASAKKVFAALGVAVPVPVVPALPKAA